MSFASDEGMDPSEAGKLGWEKKRETILKRHGLWEAFKDEEFRDPSAENNRDIDD